MNALKFWKMSKRFSSLCLLVFGVVFTLSAQVIVEENSDLRKSRENKEQLIISPKSQLVIQPEIMEEYSSEKSISIRSGTSIRPGQNGWFRAEIKETQNIEISNITNQFNLYPNPVASGKLTVDLPGENVQVYLFDLNGRQLTVPTISKNKSQLELDLSSLKPGIYLLQCEFGHSIFQKKVLKQ